MKRKVRTSLLHHQDSDVTIAISHASTRSPLENHILRPMALFAEYQPLLQSNVVIAGHWCNCNGPMDTDCVSIICMLFCCCLHGLILVVLSVPNKDDEIQFLRVALCCRQLTCLMRRSPQYFFQLMIYASADVKCSFAQTFSHRQKMLTIHSESPQVHICVIDLKPHFTSSLPRSAQCQLLSDKI